MSATIGKLQFVRRVIRGISGPQPLAGTPQRAADAYAAMCAAEWAESDDGPAIPAHDYVAIVPAAGDAYRQTWGYDGDARTERSACGAACYTFKLPADALTGEACEVQSATLNLCGDRYLECGAIVTFLASDSAVPPPFAQLVAAGEDSGPWLIPDTTVRRVNDRVDTTKTLTWTPSATLAAPAYLHVCIRVADYLAARGAWHEGGAMLDPESLSVTFSRDAIADDTAVTARWTPPEEEMDGEAALSRAAVVFGSLSWPTGICAGLPEPALWDACDDAMRLPYVAAENVFNGHHCARLGRWPDASGTAPDGDWAAVGAVEERWSGQSFPWLCGFILGLRVHLRGRARTFSSIGFGSVPETPGLVVRCAAYLAGDPPAAASGLRLSTPDAARLDWERLFIGSATSLPLCGGGEMALSPVSIVRIDLADGATGMPAVIRVEDAATMLLAVSPVAPESYARVNWPLTDWSLT